MKDIDIEKAINNLCDSEKFRLLYRIELVDLNKKLSGVLARCGVKGENYSTKRREIYHAFFDEGGKNAGNYKQMEIRLANLKGSISEYFNAKTMFAFALFVNVLVKEFDLNKNFNLSLLTALKTLRKYFKTEELKFKDMPVKLDVKALSTEQKTELKQKLMEYFNVGELFYNLYYDAEVEKEIKKKGGDEENC